jgi:kynureninase
MAPLTLEQLQQYDQQDLLAHKRAEFTLPEHVIYFDGNSLGAMPSCALQRAQDVLARQWSQDLIQSWNSNQWIDLPIKVGEQIGRLIGAESGQVICCDSTSVNLFKVLSCALLMQPERTVVLTQQGNFPTDLYMVQGLRTLVGEKRCQLLEVAEQDLEQALNNDVAVLMLTQVDFRSGRLLDIQRLTQIAHEQGVLVIVDLAHSAGALPVELDAWQVDFAVGCGYKYLNGGPGAPAFLYAAKRHHAAITQPLSGWMGHKTPFSFSSEYVKSDGIEQFLTGTPAVISMSVLDAALQVFSDISMQQIREKSLGLTSCFHQLVQQQAALAELTLITPLKPEARGSQLAYQHPQAYALCQALIKRGVIADFRAPDILRLGFTPLYIRYIDLWHAVEILTDIVASQEYLKPEYAIKQKVT